MVNSHSDKEVERKDVTYLIGAMSSVCDKCCRKKTCRWSKDSELDVAMVIACKGYRYKEN